jgi:hypothetical protein
VASEKPPAGYYPDPTTGAPRWFDGEKWGQLAPGFWKTSDKAQHQPINLLLVASGYLFAIAMPLIGFSFGVIAAGERQSEATRRNGHWIMGMSLLFLLMEVIVLTVNGVPDVVPL